MKISNVWTAIGLLAAGFLFVGFTDNLIEPQVIYGEDNRQEVYEVTRADVRDVAGSSVALLSKSDLTATARGTFNIKTVNYGRAENLCSTEKFFTEPEAAFCSGTLVGEDLIATAGHCVDENTCAGTAFVFGFRMINKATARTEVSQSEVYYCKKIVKAEQTDNQDYALVRLNRPVMGHKAVALSHTPARVGDPVYLIGHPTGLPTKVAMGARVRSQKNGYFVASTDSYAGNSGSGVFNENTNEMLGILVRGERDFVYDGSRGCNISKVCTENGCRGEDVTNVLYIRNALSGR